MYCPSCLCEKTKVYKTIKDVDRNERYRVCEKCGFTFLTEEKIKVDKYWAEYKEYTEENDRKEHKQQSYIDFEGV